MVGLAGPAVVLLKISPETICMLPKVLQVWDVIASN